MDLSLERVNALLSARGYEYVARTQDDEGVYPHYKKLVGNVLIHCFADPQQQKCELVCYLADDSFSVSSGNIFIEHPLFDKLYETRIVEIVNWLAVRGFANEDMARV